MLWKKTTRDTYQAMEGFIHNLNTMHPAPCAQVPFSSINYGTDTSWEGRLAIEQLLLAAGSRTRSWRNTNLPDSDFPCQRGCQL